MKNVFLFRRQEVSNSSTFASDSGVGLDLLGVSADLLAFMTAEEGKVKIVFNNATTHDDNNLVEGDSTQKTSVTVGCGAWQEREVIESMMKLAESETGRPTVLKVEPVAGIPQLNN